MDREEAIEVIKELQPNDRLREALRTLIPELRESEDERIRKAIVKFFKAHSKKENIVKYNGVDTEDIIAYLEKQKESLHISETRKENADSFTDEDERIREELIGFIDKVHKDNDVLLLVADKVGNDIPNMIPSWIAYLEKQKEQKEQKPIFRVGDTMRTWDEAKRGIKDGLPHIISINSTDYLCNNEAIRISDQGDYEFPPMNRKQPVKLDDDTEVGLDRALQIVKDAKGNLCGYQSDDGIYECDHAIQTLERILKNGIEQKPAEWSEEDEKCIKDIIICLEYLQREDAERKWNGDRNVKPERYDGMIAKLKSLRPQPHWKPSEEQMNAVRLCMTAGAPKHRYALESLYEQLKKL